MTLKNRVMVVLAGLSFARVGLSTQLLDGKKQSRHKAISQITAATISLKGCEGRSLVNLGDKFNVSTGLA